MPNGLNRGPAAYVAGPLFFVAVACLEVAAPFEVRPAVARSIEARAVEIREIEPAKERRAQLVRTFDGDGTRQAAEAPLRVRAARTAAAPFALLWSMVLALGLAAAVAGCARLRDRVAIHAR
jgi:hypothetical protein